MTRLGESGDRERSARLRVAANVRILRLLNEWSQDDLAAAADVSRSCVGGIERAEYNIGVDTLERIAGAMGAGLDELFAEPDPNALGEAVIRRIRRAVSDGGGFQLREPQGEYRGSRHLATAAGLE